VHSSAGLVNCNVLASQNVSHRLRRTLAALALLGLIAALWVITWQHYDRLPKQLVAAALAVIVVTVVAVCFVALVAMTFTRKEGRL
jgi:MFS superfamily sulfate permease-like transporter